MGIRCWHKCKIMRNNVLMIGLTLYLLGCSSKEKEPPLKRIDFIRSVSKRNELQTDLKKGEYLTFKFLNLYYKTETDTSDYSRALYITVPAADTSFSFVKDSTHSFKHLVADCRGLCPDINIEDIKDAEINGRLIGKEKWFIEAKTKHFDFKRVIPLTFNVLEKETINLK